MDTCSFCLAKTVRELLIKIACSQISKNNLQSSYKKSVSRFLKCNNYYIHVQASIRINNLAIKIKEMQSN